MEKMTKVTQKVIEPTIEKGEKNEAPRAKSGNTFGDMARPPRSSS